MYVAAWQKDFCFYAESLVLIRGVRLGLTDRIYRISGACFAKEVLKQNRVEDFPAFLKMIKQNTECDTLEPFI